MLGVVITESKMKQKLYNGNVGADAGFFKMGGGDVQLRSTRTNWGRGPALGPMIKSLDLGPKRGETPGPPPPGICTCN